MATASDVQRDVRRDDDLGDEPRAWRLALGVVMAVIGLMSIGTAKVTGMAAVIMAGTALAVAGFVEVLSGLGRRTRQIQPLRLLGGLLSVTVGAVFILRPMTGLTAITLLLAGYFMAAGLFHCITSVGERYAGWGWDVLYGLCAIALSVYTFTSVRASEFWLVGALVGVEILLRGLALTFGGFRRGQHRRELRSTTLKHA